MSEARSRGEGMLGSTISRYEIVAKIGAGGMGEVYRAHDPSIGRDVAIKILPEDLRDEPSRLRRFEKEVRAAGGLNHPNILAVHDIGMYEGRPYLVSELLEGSSLRERMDAGDLTVRRTLQLAVEVAEGLAAAHVRGIVHRDIKPGNIFVTADGHAKILDFGVAKLAEDRSRDGISTHSDTEALDTQPGVLVGTPAYMSPEQVQGLEIDHRSDIFSFGVLIYEMLSGRRPFNGGSAPQLAIAIMHDDPPPLSVIDGRVPPAVEEVIFRCLEKNPDERFHSAHDLALALGAAAAPSGAVPTTEYRRRVPWRKLALVAVILLVAVAAAVAVRRLLQPMPLPERLHLAVMRFTSTSDSEDDLAFAVGLGEDLRDQLALFEEQEHGRMWVLSRRDLLQDWGADLSDLSALSRLHDVTLGLKATVTPPSDRVMLHLELVDAVTGAQLRELAVDLDLGTASKQRGILEQLAGWFGLEIGEEAERRAAARSTDVVGALAAYLRGRGAYALHRTQPETAVRHFEIAIHEDPSFAVAHAWLALARLRPSTRRDGRLPDTEGAIQAARRAISLAPWESTGYLALSRAQRSAGLEGEAIATLANAPDGVQVTADFALQLGELYKSVGRFDDAEAAFERAANLRPGYWESYWRLGALFFASASYDAAANRFRRACALAPQNTWSSNGLAAALLGLGRRDEARAVWELQVESAPSYATLSNLGFMAFDDQNFGEAAVLFERAIELDDGNHQVWSNLGAAYYWSNNLERARQAFRRAIVLTDAEIESNPNDPGLLAVQASNLAMFGDRRRGLELAERAASLEVTSSEAMATIAEAFEDLDDRERAMEWIHRAVADGYSLEAVGRKPAFRDLRTDPRFLALGTDDTTHSSSTP